MLLLNADTELTPKTVQSITGYLNANPRVAIAGPRIVNAAGTYERSAHGFPTPISLLLLARWWPGPQVERPSTPTVEPERRPGALAALARRDELSSPAVRLGARCRSRHSAGAVLGGMALTRPTFSIRRRSTSATGCGRQGGKYTMRRLRPSSTLGAPARRSRPPTVSVSSSEALNVSPDFDIQAQGGRYTRCIRNRTAWPTGPRGRPRLASAGNPERRDRIRGRIAAWRRGLTELREGRSAHRGRSEPGFIASTNTAVRSSA